jgi:poly(ADP-ribose) glycohydrolase ARH3
MPKTDLRSKFLGAMVGSALGDAIGQMAFTYPQKDSLSAALESTPEYRYTDDTAMAIGLAESLTKMRRVDRQDLGKTFRDHFHREPWRGYASGPPTIFSLVSKIGMTYAEAARVLFEGKGSLGNGAAMRIAPLGLFFHRAPDLYAQACLSAQVTHAHPVGMDGAAVQAYAVAQAADQDPGIGFPLGSFMERLIHFARTPEIQVKMKMVKQLITEGVDTMSAARRLGQTVAVHESMPFAVYCFLCHTDSFKECLFAAVLHGGDRDTLGAMACAISGAYLGVEAIPSSWRGKLENRGHIERLAADLLQSSG